MEMDEMLQKAKKTQVQRKKRSQVDREKKGLRLTVIKN